MSNYERERTAVISVGKGVTGCTCTPEGGEKMGGGQRQKLQVHPQTEQKSIFTKLGDLDGESG